MSFLLDTSVISEWVKPRPTQSVDRWLRSTDPIDLHASVISFAEISRGFERLPEGRRKAELSHWLTNDLRDYFGDNLLPLGVAVAERWGVISAANEAQGRRMPVMDAFIAATADVHGLTLITRNVRDFEAWGGQIFNPWGA